MSGSAIVAWSGGCSEEVEQPQGSGVDTSSLYSFLAFKVLFTVPTGISRATARYP
jgi:hypothetical protein